MTKKRQHSFVYRNGLTLVLIGFFLASFTGQILTGFAEYNSEREENSKMAILLGDYFSTGHFLQTTFENWESEFLQMGMYVLLTVWLRQLGSSESKDLDEKEAVDRDPSPLKKDAPWPVKRGGLFLAIYRNSLSIAFILLFIGSFILHSAGSLKNYNEELMWRGKPTLTIVEFMKHSRFWFESFQNWQSEFVAVISIVVLSVYLRQYGSPESKPVDASMAETGSG